MSIGRESIRPRHVLIAAVAAVLAAGSINIAAADESPFLVSEHVTIPPKHKTIRKHFRPWAHPTAGQVRIILHEEQKRWGGPHLGGRVACESGYRWWATNGQYRGLLQFGPIWGSMWSGAPRGVRYVTTHKRKKPIRRHRHWSDGRWTHHTVRNRIQVIRVIRHGRIPRSATPFHGWAAIRVGQRAVSGDGPSTGWECGV